MRHSVLFGRLFRVVVLMILMTVILTTAIYTYTARDLFTSIKEDELRIRADALASVVGEYRNNEADLRGLFRTFSKDEASSSLLGAHVVLVDETGENSFISSSLEPRYRPSMVEAARDVFSRGEVLRTEQIPALKHTSMVGVGVPVVIDGETRGAVLLVVPLFEAMVAMGSLNSALMLSLMFSLPLTAVVVYYAIGRVVNPMRQMTGVATKMAGGDFSQRADVSQKGEVGELGSALNYLSHELSRTISTLTLERNRLKQILDGLSEGIVAVDAQVSVTHINPAVEHMFAGATSGIEGAKFTLDADIWADFGSVVERGEPIARPLQVHDRIIMMTIAPIRDDADEIAGAVALFSDITESERLERTRRDYVANVSHEMRTPLTAMRALLEPLSDGMVASEDTKKRYYAIMLRETMRLSRLINDQLELSRLQSGALALSTQPMRLDDVFSELADKYHPIAEERGLTFIMDASLQDCPMVQSNPDRVEQVLVILIDNAMKYTHEGGSVSVFAEWDEEKVTLQVVDTGIGIDSLDQACVFDRFYKVDRAHSGLGSGLGLSIAKELLKLMGEGIGVESAVGEGSTFFFTLKRAGS